jgi:hypothetical protein
VSAWAATTTQAAIVNYDMEWTGSDGGYYALGAFSYDDSFADDNLITAGELSSVSLTIIDPSDIAQWTFDLTNQDLNFFSFNFETDTEIIRQGPPGSFPSSTAFLFINDDPSQAPIIGGETFCGPFIALNLVNTDCDPLTDQGGVLTATFVPEPNMLVLIDIGLLGLSFGRQKQTERK